MPLTIVGEFEVLSGFRPRADKRFYFLLANIEGKRIFKHCVWIKKESELLSDMSPGELTGYLYETGIAKVRQKINERDYSDTIEVIEKDSSYMVNLDTVQQKLEFDW
jgi:hypothetical protein